MFRSRDAAALPALEQAFAAEQDPTSSGPGEARAAILLPMPRHAPSRCGWRRWRRCAQRGDRMPWRSWPPCRHGAATACALPPRRRRAIERHLGIVAAAQNVVFGISLGSVLLLAAIGLAITFGVMGVINMAHGEMVMLGAYTTFVIQEFCRTSFPAGLEWSLLVAVPAAFLVAGAHGRADRADRHPSGSMAGRSRPCSPPGASR